MTTGNFPGQDLLRDRSVRLGQLDGALPAFIGTGFFVRADTIATAGHVVEAALAVSATVGYFSADGHLVEAELLGRWADGALLRVRGEARSSRYVAHNPTIARDDALDTFGFPQGEFNVGGTPSPLVAAGTSYHGGDRVPRLRYTGLPPGAGASGSPVLNLRTGGVFGLVVTSDFANGTGHVEPLGPLLDRVLTGPAESDPEWLDALTDGQIRAGSWALPTRRLRRLVEAVHRQCEEHPHPGMLFEIPPPKLSKVYGEPVFIKRPRDKADMSPTRVTRAMLANGGLLIGTPGGGKSSTLRMVAAYMCEEFAAGRYSRVPVIVNAADIRLDSPLSESLASAANLTLFNGERVTDADLFSQEPTVVSQWHLLIDGFDEVLDPTVRAAIVAKLTPDAHDHAALLRHTVIASRPLPPAEYESMANLVDDAVFVQRPFEGNEVLHVMTLWLEALGVIDPGLAAARALGQMQVTESDALLRNPLMLAMTAQLYALSPDRDAPGSRSALYRQFLDAIRKRFFTRGAGNPGTQAAAALEHFGPQGSEAARTATESIYEDLGRSAYGWLSTDADEQILSDLLDHRRPRHVTEGAWADFTHDIIRRSGVAIQDGGSFRFLHQTLAEFLAAQVAVSGELGRRDALRDLLAPNSSLSSKYSFIRFAASGWASNRSFRGWLLRAIADDSDERAPTLVTDLLDDGVVLPRRLSAALAQRLRSELERDDLTDHHAVLLLVTQLSRVVDAGLLTEVVRALVRRTELERGTRTWAIAAVGSRVVGVSERLNTTEPSPASVQLALDALAASSNQQDAELMEFVRQDPELRGLVETATLRTILPTLFARTAHERPLELLLATVQTAFPQTKMDLIQHAFALVQRAVVEQSWHEPPTEREVPNPAPAAQILAELGFDRVVITAALLNGVPLAAEELAEEFGDEIASLVAGAAQLRRLTFGGGVTAETARKMMIAMSKDLRMLAIVLAERLRDARGWGSLTAEVAAPIAQDTWDIFVPLADWMGLEALRRELDDLSFAAVHPKLYVEIESLVRARIPGREQFVSEVVNAIGFDVKRQKIRATIVGRAKQYAEIYREMVVDGKEFDSLFDLVTVRIVADTLRNCYAVLGSIHARWTPIPGMLKDYIATPKFDLYQSVHTSVIGPRGTPITVFIRTVAMQERIDKGGTTNSKLAARLGEAGSLSAYSTAGFASSFFEILRDEVGASTVFVYTPKGDIITLPAGSTPVDFAYAVHTEVGHRTIGARVNGLLVPLESVLDSGDTVEIFTSRHAGAGPQVDWLDFVQDPRSKRQIRRWHRLFDPPEGGV
ncbi:(p)ppGpp synthetase, RelA/SpoT family [Plantibacter sp. VKM Ac-1784]|uniref:(P)ppGpp synthetase, RelA/SpoT family n=1 Tax=Plantibacter elymi (nom. nud.) TaxID=199708 RepID=A0ABY1RAW9_9MICO|nr:TGS domain-containing protein [Plantibacter sp. VKM Ac-1784]SMQ66972.1 (p)ppGpp synthetase, RelA/SpoT family [Plantibacter sp. VKM Ac-1784]